jgi:23S rRNA (guanosine2251-2'-O)-methyltransferase
VRELWVAQGLDPSPTLDAIERAATRLGVRVLAVSKRRLEAVARTDSAQGVLARADPLEEVSLDALCDGTASSPTFLLILDALNDPQNLGAILRTAEFAGVNGVVLPRHRAAHVTPTAAKVAAGAIEHLRMAVVPGTASALLDLEKLGVVTVGLDAEAPSSIFELGEELEGPVALVLGAEGRGLSSLVRRRCDVLASIPRHGSLDSLNVAAAGAVACFEVARRRGR